MLANVRGVVLGVLAAALSGAAVAQEALESVPRELHGTWGSDCASPEMLFEETAVQQRGDKVKSPVRRVVRRQGEIDVHYDRLADKVSVVDTFRIEGSSLRLTASQYGAMRTAWNKRPWQRCGAAPQQAAAQPSGRQFPVAATIPIGPWTVTANNDQAGKFAHCELMRRDGTLTFGITRGSAGYVKLMVDESWTAVKAGAKYDLRLEGTGLQARSVSATSVASGIVAVLGPDQGFINQLKNLTRLDVRTPATVIPVPMNMADAALTELQTCWNQNSGTNTNPFAPR